ncbi:hypothetical protein [Chryseobacterium piscicola]|uniref:Glycosyltransferase RgtA/B/C/D-like domain-containing protein n=1 Tax=Chryseobacterium piscicola TaxID=551459 RepID=A0A2S7KH71_9FLAO|nr:hypothetical protein [Chryseobacterium piscicola]PQA96355.1 hypothetical protein B0A70_04350 [Chryseobacterium piscicola]
MKKNIIIFLLLLLFYFLALQYFNVIFLAGDDGYMMRIANGSFFGVNDYHLVFINSILGKFFVFLYSHLPYYEWYFVIFIFLQFISSFIIICELSKRMEFFKLFIFLLPLFYYLCFLNFTTLTFLLTFSGFLLLDSYINNKKNIFLIGSALSLFIGLLYRLEMVLLCAALFFIYLLLKEHRKSYKILLVYFLFFCATTISLNTYNKKTYAESKDWQFYFDYNKERGSINDNFGVGYLLGELKEENDPLENDLKLAARNFIFTDQMSLEKLKEINHNLTSDKSISYYNILKNIRFTSFFLLILICFFSVILFIIYKKQKTIAVVVVLMLMMFYLTLHHTLKDRIIFPMIFLTIYFILDTVKFKISKKNKIQSSIIFVLLAIMVEAYWFYPEKKKQFEKLDLSSKTIMLDGSNYFAQTSFIKMNETTNIIPGGWFTNFPLVKEKTKNNYLGSHLSLIDDKYLNENFMYFIFDKNTHKLIDTHLKKSNRKLITVKNNLYKIQ